ncbi:hypothetical protein TI04_12575 [Achromatium sp. WMS2]|nr:hypothetical protein TI04_12575 [Achromatium sp. WMS2]
MIFYRNNCSMLSQSNMASDQVSNCSTVAVSSLQMLAGDNGPNFLVSRRLSKAAGLHGVKSSYG